MTSTTIVSAQSIGTGSNIGNDKFPTSTTLQSTTTAIQLELQITNGASNYKGIRLKLWYAYTSFTYASATLAMQAIRQSAQSREIHFRGGSGDVEGALSDLYVVGGGLNLVAWFEIPTLPVAATLSCNLIELP